MSLTPHLSILTATFNHRDYLATMYASLVSTSAGLDWEWLVGDSGTDDSAAFLTSLNDRRVRHFRLRPASYGAINNELAARARGQAFAFVNNDVIVCDAWWHEPLALLRRPDVAVVGSVLFNDDGTLQSAGMGLTPLEPYSYNFALLASHLRASKTAFVVPAVTGACFFVTARTFKLLGGFDRDYVGGYYEDTDLCLRAYANGGLVVVAPSSRIVHKSLGSRDVSTAYWSAIPRNRALFRDRWHIVLERLRESTPQPLDHSRPETVACINPWLPTLGGGEREFLWAVDFLSRYCGSVTICGIDTSRHIDATLQERFGCSIPAHVELSSNKELPEATTLVWDHTYYDITTTLATPRRRHIKRIMFGPTRRRLAEGPYYLFNSCYTRAELRSTPNGTVMYPPVVQSGSCDERLCHDDREPVILSCGRFAEWRPYLNWKNQEALVRFFLAWRGARRYTLALVGSVNDASYLRRCRDVARGGRGDRRVVFCPNVSASEYDNWLHRSAFFLSFAGFGGRTAANAEHFGIAVVEAMAHGCVCLVYAAGGHREIITHGIDGYLWSSESQLATILSTLAADERLRRRVARAARRKARQFRPMFAELQLRTVLRTDEEPVQHDGGHG